MVDCAVREVKEETGLDVNSLVLCGVVHWTHITTDRRYICFMYKTNAYSGDLIENCKEGDNTWINVRELHKLPRENFSSVPEIYALSPLLHKKGDYNEAFIEQDDDSVLNILFK